MRTEIWIEYVDDDGVPPLKITNLEDAGALVVPQVGEQVGWRGAPGGGHTYILDWVVRVRHYVFEETIKPLPGQPGTTVKRLVQEIHVMTSHDEPTVLAHVKRP